MSNERRCTRDVEVVVPRNVSFDSLMLQMRGDGRVLLNAAALQAVCETSALPPALLFGGEDPMLLPAILGAWVSVALEEGESIAAPARARQIIDAMSESAWSEMGRRHAPGRVHLTLLAYTKLH